MSEFELAKDNAFVKRMVKARDNALRPCPFCGGEGEIVYILGEDPYLPQCKDEKCIAYHILLGFETEAEAIEAWNRRDG